MGTSALNLEAVTTFGGMKAKVARWVQEPIRTPGLIEDAVNDAYEKLWMKAILATLSRLTKGAVTQVIGTSQLQLVSVPDPTVTPVATPVAGGALLARTYYYAVALITESGTTTLPSPVASIALAANTLFSLPIYPQVAGAFAYQVYAGVDPVNLTPQIPGGQTFGNGWLEPATGIRTNLPGLPAQNTTGDNIFALSSLQVANQDGTMTQWEQADVASTLVREQQLALPTGSSYQRQAYDLLSGNQLTIFPGPGASFTGNYFYIARPRRMIYQLAPLPFPDFPNQSFILNQTLAAVHRHLSEWTGAAVWQKVADSDLADIVQALTVPARQQNTRVVPYMRGW